MALATRLPPLDLRDRLLALSLMLAGLISRLPFLGSDDGWFDEHFAIIVSTQSVREILRDALLEQSNPPGYYLLAHLWGLMGSAADLSWHRLVPALCGALIPVITALAIRRLGFSRTAALVAGVILVVAPIPWTMSIEVRGYATVALCAACALYVAAGIIAADVAPARRSYFTLALLNVAQVLLHYFGAFSVLGVSLAVAERERRRVGGTATVQLRTFVRVAGVLGAPAALTIAAWMALSLVLFDGAGARNIAWIPETSTWSAVSTVSEVLLATMTDDLGTWMSRLLLVGGLGVATAAALRMSQNPARSARGRIALLVSVVPLVAVLTVNAASGNDLWVSRYIGVLTPGFALLVAMVVDAVTPRWRTVTAIGIAAWWGVAGMYRFANRVPKPDWSTLIATLAPRGEATFCTDRWFVSLPLVYHVNIAERQGIAMLQAPVCRPGRGITWLVYDAKPSGVTAPPQVPGLELGPRIVLFRGMHNLDARRVITRGVSSND